MSGFTWIICLLFESKNNKVSPIKFEPTK